MLEAGQRCPMAIGSGWNGLDLERFTSSVSRKRRERDGVSLVTRI